LINESDVISVLQSESEEKIDCKCTLTQQAIRAIYSDEVKKYNSTSELTNKGRAKILNFWNK